MQRRTCILVNKNSFFNMLANNSRDYSTSAKPFNTITVFGSGYVGKNVAWKVAPLAEQVIIVSRSGDSLSKNGTYFILSRTFFKRILHLLTLFSIRPSF